MPDDVYCIYDSETMVQGSYNRYPNQFDKRNKVISAQWIVQGSDPIVQYSKMGLTKIKLPYDKFNVLVGQNIKFDLLWFWDDPDLQAWLRRGGRVYDTMTAEFLLNGQHKAFKYMSLDRLSAKYGGTQKDDRLKKDYFSKGIGPESIDPEILFPYGVADVKNTEIVYLKQLEALQRANMLPLVLGYMEHYLALIEMEFNGLYIDLPAAKKLAAELREQLADKKEELAGIVADVADLGNELEFNPDSKPQISALLFNTPISMKLRVPSLDENGEQRYYGPKAAKAGQPQSRLEMCKVTIETSFRLKAPKGTKKDKRGVYSVDEDTLKTLLKKDMASVVRRFITSLLEYRKTHRVVSTYLEGHSKGETTGMIPMVMKQDGCIHHNLDQCLTATGRINASNPNAQNIPKNLRSIFVSRYGPEGRILELDYSTLEVVVQAYLTQSEKMIRDIEAGTDFHIKRLAYSEEISYEDAVENLKKFPEIWKGKRQQAKRVTYQKAYGAGPGKIADSTGLLRETVEKIFSAEDAEYPEIKLFNDQVQDTIKTHRVPTDTILYVYDKDTGAKVTRVCGTTYYQGIGYYQSITGKCYSFLEKAVTSDKLKARGKNVFVYFPPTQTANRPVQGTASDIVSLSVGRVFRWLKSLDDYDKVKMINEVHDSLVLDCPSQEVAEYISRGIKLILEDVDRTFKERLGLGFNVPIHVDITISPTWRGDNVE